MNVATETRTAISQGLMRITTCDDQSFHDGTLGALHRTWHHVISNTMNLETPPRRRGHPGNAQIPV